MNVSELPAYINESIQTYKPVYYDGLTLYPIRVKHYRAYSIANSALGFMQQSLPIELMSMPFLSALYCLDYDRLVDGEQATGLFSGCLNTLAYSLRLTNYENAEAVGGLFEIVVNPENPRQLKGLRCVIDGEENWTITPAMFSRLRPIIAAQNGIKLIDEEANPELVEAERDLAESRALKLEGDIDVLVHSVAAVSGKDEDEIYEWPMLKLINRAESYKRIMDYIICGMGETQGTKWKGGNPCPHPWFNKVKDDTGGLIALESFAGGQATQTVVSGEMNRQHADDSNTIPFDTYLK